MSVPAEVSCRKEGYGIKSATQPSEAATIHKGRRWYSFKRRYFVLYEDSLKYFTDHTLKTEKGSILLTNGQALQAQVFEANSVEGGQVAHKQFGVTHLLEVVADSRIFVMGLLSEEEAYSWRRLLKVAAPA
ncbi:hypothetical protein CYMTET_19749 [Cymbomonas tetramitiformis]|uniref:PH domain-containing protein n=1 Tax=Cymbomonas tetramitiformis TaxID=36881 RepID=A0AAE0G5Z0_9CHLO|nr:hypothetical protein CYMTET_19749 [Cymbomonas tetramitiformis]